MKQFMLCLLAYLPWSAALAQVMTDSAWRSDVKTVILSRNEISQQTPVLAMGSGERLALQFDVLRENPESLRCRFVHCDAAWHADDLQPYEFMNGPESTPLDDYDFSFTTRVPYVHYRLTFPTPYTEFLCSGNYLLVVSLDGEPDSILLTRRFCVSEQSAKVEASIVPPYDGIGLRQRQQVNVDLTLPAPAVAPQYITVVAQQNGRLDNMRPLQFSGYAGDKLAFRNRPCNIFDGGNTFRFFDMSNLHTPMYNVQRIETYGGETFVIIRPEEDRSAKHYVDETTLNGGLRVHITDRSNPSLEADYVWVNLSLPMPQPLMGGTLHVAGALTDWQLDSASRMDYNPRFRAYTKRLLLKQGYYAYQLLYLDRHLGEAQTSRIEGDHWETPNQYTLYVYQRQPSDRFDRLLAVGQVSHRP